MVLAGSNAEGTEAAAKFVTDLSLSVVDFA
jgi:hypothetical protein